MEKIKEDIGNELSKEEEVFNEEEFNKTLEEMDKTIKEIETPNITNILRDFKFKNKVDEEVFNRLPLTNIQKEYLLLSVNTDLLKGEVPAEHGYVETEKKIEIEEVNEDIHVEITADKKYDKKIIKG
jgi:hypothetical protein